MLGLLSTLRAVFFERNVFVLSSTSCLYTVFNGLWQMWWSLYLLQELGAPIPVVGLLSTLQGVSELIFQWPGGVLADRVGRKRVIAAGTTLRFFGPLIMLLAPSWEWVVPGMVINAAASVYTPAFQAIIADSLPYDRRGAAYGAYRMFTSLPQIGMPVLSGLYMDRMGIGAGVRLGLAMHVAVSAVVSLLRAVLLRETLERGGGAGPSTGAERPSPGPGPLLGRFRGTLLAMLAVACVSGFAMGMVYPFLVVYAVQVVGLSKAQWGALQTIATAISTPLLLVGGMAADRFGRTPFILTARSILPLEALALIFVHDFQLLVAVFASLGVEGGLGGGGPRGAGGDVGGPAWSALAADIIPREDRGKVLGVMATLTGIVTLPAPMVGALLWERSGPDLLLGAGGVLGLSVVPIILLFVREPKTRQR